LKLNYDGKANVKQASQQWIIDTKKNKKLIVRYKSCLAWSRKS